MKKNPALARFLDLLDILRSRVDNSAVYSDEIYASADNNSEGVVTSFKDSVVTISGLPFIKANELIYFSNGVTGLALNLEYGFIKALVFGSLKSVKTGDRVIGSGLVMQVGVGSNILGRVINALGAPLDGFGPINTEATWAIERKAPGVITRKKVSTPLLTGIKVVDALVPIGRGQRELILGDRKTGKTMVAVDTIINQSSAIAQQLDAVNCIYVAIGKRMSEVVRIIKIFSTKRALSNTVVVVAQASDAASLQYIAPYSACTMAEYFTYKGQHSLIVYDDLSKHADVYRQLSLLLRRPVGREAYPGDVFYLHSRLLERAVNMNSSYSGGSLTALPIVETMQGDVSAYIPTNIISITDGQIYLDLNKHQEGVRPAVDAGLSVSRVGSAAQCKSVKKLAGSLKLELAQYREVEQFSKFGSELDAATKKILANGKLFIEILKQPRNSPLSIYKQIMILFAASSGFFDKIDFSAMNVSSYQDNLFFFLERSILFAPFVKSIELEFDPTILDFLLNIHANHWLYDVIDNNVLSLDINWYPSANNNFIPLSF